MMFRKTFILALFLVGCTQTAPTEFSEKALADLFFTEEKKTVQLKEILAAYEGEKVVLNIWASWCKDCIVAIPKMKELQAKYPNVNYVFISSDRNVHAWKRALTKYRIQGNHYFMKKGMDGDFGIFLNSNWIPRYLVVNENGFVDLFKATKITDKRIVNALKK